MKTKKFLALTIVALLALILTVPLASNTAAPNPLTPAATAATVILPQQGNTPPAKAIPTNPLGPYNLTDGERLSYSGIMDDVLCFPIADWGTSNIVADYDFGYDESTWGDWFIALLGTGPIPSIAIHNQTREIGLNGTEPFWNGVPDNESVITRLSGVYSFIAIPTGVKAGDHLKIMTPVSPWSGDPWVQVTFEVLGRITTPIIGSTEFYDTWILHGTYTGTVVGYPFSIALELGFDTETGLLVSSTMGASMVDGYPELYGWHALMQYDSSGGVGSPAPLTNTRIDYTETAEAYLLTYTTFTYDEDGYWYMDWSGPTNGSVGKVKLTSLDESYMNFTLYDMSYDWSYMPIGISQTTKIPDNLWNYLGSWNPTYYNSTTQIGHVEDWIDYVYIQNFTRWVGLDSPNSMFMAPPWIRDGVVFLGLAFLPVFWPDNSTPSVGFPDGGWWPTITLLMPFRVSGAVTVGIDGNSYDCWRTELVIPSDLSDLNISQFQYEAYYERTSGVLIKAKADLEMKYSTDGSLIPVGYHKTWTLSDSSAMVPPFSVKSLPTPEEMGSYYNTYSMVFGGNSLDTLDPSLFNGGSVTANCSNENYITMWTTTQLAGNSSIGGKPIVKFMYVDPSDSVTYYTAVVNFYYTPSELSAMGADESGFSVYAWNGTAWEPLGTTWDAEGRVVSANASHFSLFALVAAEHVPSIWEQLGPVGSALLLSALGQAAAPPLGGMLPFLGIGLALLAVLAVLWLFLKGKPK